MACAVFADKQGSARPLKVVILAGQSNMQQPAGWNTLKGLADTPETKSLYDKLVDDNGRVRTFKDVRIAHQETTNHFPDGFAGQVLGDNGRGRYGPELGFGLTFHELVDEPVLIIKTAWGGKSLHTDFRPPTGKAWEPPKDHPDHPDNAPPARKIPSSIELPPDFQPPQGRGQHIQMMSGRPIGEISGVHPIYVMDISEKKKKIWGRIPFQAGDLILGLNGEGLGEDPVQQWRKTWFEDVRKGDWKLTVTYWRDGGIDTVEIDTSKQLADGRDGITAYRAEQKATEEKLLREGGDYYRMMMQTIKDVLADPGKHHPAYDPDRGIELSGFVWFQGYNDKINGGVYPNGRKPRGYERYSWLLAELIRDVRKELKAPDLPFVIGVFGQGGRLDHPDFFRDAMAAPAGYDEFRGTVAAVETAEFWDARIPEIQGKLDRVMRYEGDDPHHPYAKLQAEIRAFKEKIGDPGERQGKALNRFVREVHAGLLDIVRTPEETAYLRDNVSNQGYHYYGSPKFFVRAGAAFATALNELMKNR
ncbi:MAG: sialate O-acetylesterase [Verrucomicrobiota bacterium]